MTLDSPFENPPHREQKKELPAAVKAVNAGCVRVSDFPRQSQGHPEGATRSKGGRWSRLVVNEVGSVKVPKTKLVEGLRFNSFGNEEQQILASL